MQLRFNTRKQLIDALEARRSWAEKHDDAQARAHRRDEDEKLKEFRGQLRELGRMNLVQLKDAVENRGRGEFYCNLPSCPASAVTLLDDALAALAVTRQERFTLSGAFNDPIYRAHWLLTCSDEPRKATVCA